MTDNDELRAVIAKARAIAGERLAADPAWRTRQQLRARGHTGGGHGISDTALSGAESRLAATLDGELAGNVNLLLANKLDEALALLDRTPVSTAKPAAAAVPTATSAPVAAAVPDDDLTRIRGIRPALAADLNRLGVRNFRQIATWTATDVRSIGAALGLDAMIHRQGWIEQAAMLDARRPPPAAAANPVAADTVSAAPIAAMAANTQKPMLVATAAAIATSGAAVTAPASASPPEVAPNPADVVATALRDLLATLPAARPATDPGLQPTISATHSHQEAQEANRRPFEWPRRRFRRRRRQWPCPPPTQSP